MAASSAYRNIGPNINRNGSTFLQATEYAYSGIFKPLLLSLIPLIQRNDDKLHSLFQASHRRIWWPRPECCNLRWRRNEIRCRRRAIYQKETCYRNVPPSIDSIVSRPLRPFTPRRRRDSSPQANLLFLMCRWPIEPHPITMPETGWVIVAVIYVTEGFPHGCIRS